MGDHEEVNVVVLQVIGFFAGSVYDPRSWGLGQDYGVWFFVMLE
jgi:hypothetical protein